MKKSILLKTFFITAALPLLSGCLVVREHPHRYRAVETVVVEEPGTPPTPRYEVVTVCPGPEQVWVPGCYEWQRGGWVWIGGRWALRPHRGAVWLAPHWEHRGRGHVWIGGGWR